MAIDRAQLKAADGPYQVLGLPPVFTVAQIKAAYRERALALHPDRNPGDAEAAELMSKVNLARDVLENAQRRKAYDAAMRVHTHLACQKCKGEGTVLKQAKGFSKVRATCAVCNGTGWR